MGLAQNRDFTQKISLDFNIISFCIIQKIFMHARQNFIFSMFIKKTKIEKS
jgi:hypothetical protein